MMNPQKTTILLVWWLWNQLINPAYGHAVFRRFRRSSARSEEATRANWDSLVLLLKIIVGILFIYLVWKNPLFIALFIFIPPIVGMGILLLPFVTPVIILVYGAVVAMNIGQVVKTEHVKNTYELVTSTAAGALPVNWLMASGVVYRGQSFSWLNMVLTFAMWIVITFILIVGGLIVLFFHTPSVLLVSSQILFSILIIMGIIYLGYMQALLVSIFVGLLLPHLDLPVYEIRFAAIFVYIAIQFGSYLTIGFLVFMLHTAFAGQYAWLDWVLPVVYLGIAYIVLELVVRWLFHALVQRINATPEDLHCLTG